MSADPDDEFANLVPFRPMPPRPLRPLARAMLGRLTCARDIAPRLDVPYLVKGWLNRDSLSVIFGPSNVGKSFLGVDIAHHVSKGRSWGGRRVNAGRVVYVAAEGGATFGNRVAALDDPEFFVLTGALSMTGQRTEAPLLAEALQHMAYDTGDIDLIVVDTMARVMGGLDENEAPAIADLIRNLDVVRRATRAHVMLVHHTGKDASKGARGHSSLRAAIDTEIELSRDDSGLITAEVTKQRDGPTGYRFDYRLRQVELGRDQDGDPVTTCLVEPADPAQAGRVVISDSARRALEVLDRALAEGGELIRRPEYPGTVSVPVNQWRDLCAEPGAVSASEARDSRLKAFKRCLDQLTEARLVLVRDDRVWVVQP